MLLFALIGVILLQVWILVGMFSDKAEVNGVEPPSAIILDTPGSIPEFTLTDHNGQEFTRENLLDRWTFVFFGYVYCPDVCPMGLVDLNDIYTKLEKDGDLVEKESGVSTQVVFISVDPERDTVKDMKEYVQYFNKDFIGVTGDPDAIKKLASSMAVRYYRTTASNGEEDDYYVNHTASFMLTGPGAGKRAVFPQPHEPGQIVEDFRNIRKSY